ncbi:hypothetical protein [Niabella ginsengisoli]|uniref:Uncharacterized protein n=1 Tax=Niabella ginsengisoli TaxID=522298 RepID=A0ABS9SE50_9BACT|nr:hypothetical protein [Niabella ginsengisoli]MCH5596623.1 hypothetical protein [Niabella ginsengisoli]
MDVNSSTMFQGSYTVIPEVQHQYGGGDAGKYAYINGSGSGIEGGGWLWGPKLDQKDPNTASGFVELPQYNSPYTPDKTYTVTFPDGTSSTGNYQPIPWVSRGKDNIRNFFKQVFCQRTIYPPLPAMTKVHIACPQVIFIRKGLCLTQA